jgi:integrase/recombinase XerD
MLEITKTEGATLTTTQNSDIWSAYLAELDASDKTRATYEKALRAYRAYLTERGLSPLEVTREAVIAYRDALKAERKPATVNAYLSAVRSFYRWTESRRIYPNVAANVKGVKTSGRSAKQSLTLEQARRLSGIKHEGLAGLRDRAMVNLMLRRGLRTIEVSRANIGDIRQAGGRAVLYVQGKGYSDKGEFVVLSDELVTQIYAYLEARGESDPAAPLFASTSNNNRGGRLTTNSISVAAKRAMAEAGIAGAGFTAHSLRHTAVTFSLLGGATVQEAQAMARHANISTTMIYAHNIDRLEAKGERAADSYLDGAMEQIA